MYDMLYVICYVVVVINRPEKVIEIFFRRSVPMKNLKILVAMVLVVLMLGTSAVAFADYPEKAIEVLIPAGPGGDTDTTVRAITASLTELLGQPVVVTNMPGGAGTVAMTELQNRDADGYTVFYHHVDTLLLELLGRMDEDWKWEDALDISAVTGGGNTYCLFVRKDNDKGLKTFEDVVNYARENPYELTYAVEMGGTLHMHALALMQALDIEVDCIDLGAEATGPNSVPVSTEEELERLIPSLQAIRSRFDLPHSVDTFKSETAKEAISAGADIINDITGFLGDPEMAKVVADNGTGCILMFNKRTNGENKTSFEPVSSRAVRELKESVEIAKKAGIPDDMIMTDPGIGFGTTRAEDAELTASTLSMGLQGKYPILYAASRKRYARIFAGGDAATEAQLDYATAGLSMTAASLGAAMVRVHNVAASRQMLDLFDNTFYAFANF